MTHSYHARWVRSIEQIFKETLKSGGSDLRIIVAALAATMFCFATYCLK